ncbi:MAG: hypothetical protein ACHQ7N_07800 [Candidatus Methylomirabilales bacterium]
MMRTIPKRGAWLHTWFGVNGSGSADRLQALLIQICRQETALACHLAERARALRFAPDRLSLEVVAERDRQNAHALAQEIGCGTTLAAVASPARRPGTLTATKLIQDLEETENLYALYRQAGRLTSDATLRGKMDEFAADEARGSQTIRAILARMDSYVTDLP